VATITWDEFTKVELRVGKITSVKPFPEARKPAYLLEVDFGEELGIKKSSAQLPHLYKPEELVAAWYVLAEQATDRFAKPEMVARKLMRFAYRVGKHNRPADQSAGQFIRRQLDALHIGADLTSIPWGMKPPIRLPPSTLPQKK